MVELRAIYWREHLSALTTQAEELRELSAKVAGGMATPIKGARVTGGMDEFCKGDSRLAPVTGPSTLIASTAVTDLDT